MIQLHDKKALRARLRAERDLFATEASAAVTPPDAFVERLRRGMVVTSYLPLGSEADPAMLAAAAAEHGCALALPHVADKATPMRFLAWHPGDALAPGPFGLRQPTGDEEVTPDVILTPLVGFDARLNRLGQGAAHYDRVFARYPDAWRVGVAWSVQEVPAIPTEMWDVPLQAVITEKGMLCHKES
ncbi:5-formyltetrahydrofolate cyclo-ligase [Sphingomonas canadensis]|uniref:5-formyltetrahydrofolate cyclo-ligase n=1 Tax=Sphingomonas canadensis TaxID=1219257 RepID=A0ABW3H8P3_9SPHN|nr:5-formyltetrahydrofolate cyclo-ligase [Sphingomonas canadensis]MCW3836786.1 5-formyltetrahydrofolate cyclo-ligase [Sphingomonas canadensis]